MTNNSERRPLRRGIRSLMVGGFAVLALVGTVTLPAHAGEITGAAAGDVTTEAASGYPPTTVESLREAEAAAALGMPAATDTPLLASQATASPGAYMHDASAPWIRPVAGRVTSYFGPRGVICNSSGCSSTTHEGVDFGSACGTPIKAVSSGRVTSATNAGAFGERVIIDHGSGVESIYGHAQAGSYKVTVGQLVSAGTVVANVGATGVATGCHLDLKIRVGGAFVDPTPWMQFRGITL